MTELDLDTLEALASAATEGPWGHYSPRGRGWPNYDPIFGKKPGDEVALVKRSEDHRFIAAARTAVPALIARVRELEAQRADVLALHARCYVEGDFTNRAVCPVCIDDEEADEERFVSWPCATVRALTVDGTPSDTERNES